MTTLATDLNSVNPYLSGLQDSFERDRKNVDWLVIAHDDPSMVRCLSQVVGNKAAMLQVPQHRWGSEAGAIADVVEWSVKQAGATQLLLVGHSQGVTELPAASEGASMGTEDSTESGYVRLLGGVRRAQEQTRRSKEQFAQHVDRLCQIQELREAIAAGQTQLHTLFYISQTGMFWRFDVANRTFTPLDR